jgi:hypothetical protein
MKVKTWFGLAFATGLVIALLPGPASASPQPQAGHLNGTELYLPLIVKPLQIQAANGGFETPDGGTGSGTADWLPWWLETPKPGDGSFNYAYRPSWNQESLSLGAASAFVYAGNSSQRVINNWDPWYAGVKQVVGVPAGTRVRLTAYGRAWASSSHWPNPSDVSVGVQMRVGLDPGGGSDPFAGTLIWSAPISPHDVWQAASVEAIVGAGDQLGVFLSTDYRGHSRQFLAGFWDEVTLEVVP